MTTEEEKIYTIVKNNSFIFFKDFIERITAKDNHKEDFISNDLIVLSFSSLQISLELAMKSLMLKKRGLRSLIDASITKSDNELYLDFKNNNLKVKRFEQIKIFTKQNNLVDDLDEDDFEIITQFQKYRNGIVHFSYGFEDGDYYDLKYDIIYFVVNILIKILSCDEDLKPSEFLEYNLGKTYHKRLTNYLPYISAMNKMAKIASEKVYTCIHCENETYSKDEDYCYLCNIYNDPEYFINCSVCENKRSVIFDGLNLENNDFSTNAKCLNCHNKTEVFMCQECEMIFDKYENLKMCTIEKCINEE